MIAYVHQRSWLFLVSISSSEVFFPCRNLITLIRLLTAIFIWCNKALYTIIDKDVDINMLMLQMSFCNLRFSRCLFCSSISITKRAIFLSSLYVPFRIHLFFYKQSIFYPRPKNYLSFSKKSPSKII